MAGRILVVDDDAALAENLAEIVGTLGVDTAVAATGAEALARARPAPPEVALVDVRLPDTDGTSLIARLRALSPFTQVVLVTGDATVESAAAAVRGGAFAYVLKPFAPGDLLDTVRRALEQAALLAERERLRAELERSERRHREVVEAVPAFVLALDPDGRVAIWNRHLEDATGFARAEMIGRPGSDLVSGAEVRPLPTKSGNERLVRWRRTTVDSDGRGWTYAVGIDVTAEQGMLRRTLRAERLAAVGTMAAGLAHEVRNPLNSARLQLTVLERRIERGDVDPAGLRAVAALVEDEIKRLELLVGDFLAFAQPRPPELRPVDTDDLLRSVASLVEPEARGTGVELRLDLAGSLPPVAGDAGKLRQVLLNLVRNALEAMAGGGTLTLRSRRTPAAVELDVADTGPGFGDDVPVFDAFFTTKPKGTGLGLAIVHRIVSDHGGTIRVRSQPEDTCFTVSLPCSP